MKSKRPDARSREISHRVSIRAEVMADVSISASARCLYFLLDHRMGESGEVWWHWRKLALACGLSHSRFFDVVKELEDKGKITIRRSGGRVFYAPSSFRKTGMNADSHSGKPECSFRKTGINGGLLLITESETEKGEIFFDSEPEVEHACYRCRDTGREVLGKRGVCRCAAGSALRISA